MSRITYGELLNPTAAPSRPIPAGRLRALVTRWQITRDELEPLMKDTPEADRMLREFYDAAGCTPEVEDAILVRLIELKPLYERRG